MRYFIASGLIIFIGLLYYSCDPCRYLDCASDNYYGQFRIISAIDGKDLVFGPNKIYDKTQIKFYSLKSTDTVFFEYQTIKFPDLEYDSILYVRFLPNTETSFMRLSNGDIDTLLLSYKTTHSRCCGSVTTIKNFRLNNVADIPGNEGTQAIKK